MKSVFLLSALLCLVLDIANAQSDYPDNESGNYEDMLTPGFYEDSVNGAFRSEINTFVHFARLLPFQHPLKDSLSENPSFMIRREFGDEMGRREPVQHHPAVDFHPENRITEITVVAAHEGYVRIFRDAPKYRHYISVTKDIEDDSGKIIGKISTIYGHVDLDLDSLAGLNVRDRYVQKGEVLSKHLYAETVGGPHLHFEIRYYRPEETGTDDFYGIAAINPEYTEKSAGPWKYGAWKPDSGYGFANPENHLNTLLTGSVNTKTIPDIEWFPNPVKDWLTIRLQNQFEPGFIKVFDLQGREINIGKDINGNVIKCNLMSCNSGTYVLSFCNSEINESVVILKQP